MDDTSKKVIPTINMPADRNGVGRAGVALVAVAGLALITEETGLLHGDAASPEVSNGHTHPKEPRSGPVVTKAIPGTSSVAAAYRGVGATYHLNYRS